MAVINTTTANSVKLTINMKSTPVEISGHLRDLSLVLVSCKARVLNRLDSGIPAGARKAEKG
jgi:hypothetical protein